MFSFGKQQTGNSRKKRRKQPPHDVMRNGNLEASFWLNDQRERDQFAFTLSRLVNMRDDQVWYLRSFRPQDLAGMLELLMQVSYWFCWEKSLSKQTRLEMQQIGDLLKEMTETLSNIRRKAVPKTNGTTRR